MKRLITNKKYDIHDARMVAEYNNGLDSSNIESCFEELYLKKSGGYFLYGRGGSKSRWADFNGEGIKLLTTKEAEDWIKIHAHDQYEYADLWGEAAE